MMNTTATAPAAIYAGIGWPETPQSTLADMTRIARWLHRTGWHLNTGGAPGAEQAFVDGTPSGARTRYLPWAGYNGHTGPDCHPLSGDERPACTRLASRLHPAWHRYADGARRLLAPVSAMILGPRLERPVDAIVSWHPERDLLSYPTLALHIAAIYRIPVLNLATDSPREVCEFLHDLRPSL